MKLRLSTQTKKFVKLLPLFLLGVLAFQNCSQASFKGIEATEQSSIVESKSSFNPITVTGNLSNTQAPTKLFLVMDFSFSMVNELNKVKSALNLFIDSQKTIQAFDIYLYPINDHIEGVTTATGQFHKLRAPLAEMQLRNNSNFASAKAHFMSALQQRIDQAANNSGETNETGLCQVVRILKQSNLYTSNDKVAFIVLTDEDDASANANSCTESAVHQPYQVIAMIYGNYLRTLATGYASGLKAADGGVMVPFTNEYFAVAPSCNSYGIGCTPRTTACSAELKDYVKAAYSPTSRIIETIHSCNVEVSVSTLGFGGLYVSDIRTLANQAVSATDVNNIVNNGQGFIHSGTSYSSLNDYVARVYPQYNSHLTFTLQSSYTETRTQHAEFSQGSSSANNSAIVNLINQKIPNSSIAMDFVIYNPALNPAGTSCGTNDIGVLGQQYMNFVNQSGRELFRLGSICQSNYNAPLVNAASLSEWVPQRDYALTGFNAENSAIVTAVKIVDVNSVVLTSLSVGQFSINSVTKVLTIPASVALPQGSKIVLE